MTEAKRTTYAPGEIHTSQLGLALLGLGVVLALLFSALGVDSVVTFQPTSGVSVFAVAYLMAQFIERIIEPFSEHQARSQGTPETRLFGDSSTIRKLRQEKEKVKTHQLEDIEEEELRKLEAKRVYSFWGLTSLLGILLSYLTLGLFSLAGITFDTFANGAITGHSIDAILSGVIIGAGTKPLHDLIQTIEKQGN